MYIFANWSLVFSYEIWSISKRLSFKNLSETISLPELRFKFSDQDLLSWCHWSKIISYKK
ncbi:hypothetical protein AB4X59_03820 [Mycoplasma feriruminatoris]|uniref:hypothetical protein n=1 Tax=Mycoplasma feriruminatoris TaxID=1179777 RepID=UPI0039E7AF89